MKFNFLQYVILNKQTMEFLCDGGESQPNIKFADKFFIIEDAYGVLAKCDEPENFEIRELKVSYDLGKIASE